MSGLVLSLFHGIGLLDRAFEETGFTVVRGPDPLWGGDIRSFHPPAGKFDGIIGGPPCQVFSRMRYLNPASGTKHGNLIPEFERCVSEAQPTWFLMENVPDAPVPDVPGYVSRPLILDSRWVGCEQQRKRRFTFGTASGVELSVEIVALESADYRQAVTSSARAVPVAIGGSGKVKRTYTAEGKRHGPDRGQREGISEMCRLQGLPPDFFEESAFTAQAQRKMLGNGVPLPMGRAVARGVLAATTQREAATP